MTQASKQSVGDRIVQASIVIGMAHLCLKFAGLIQAKVATHYLDPTVYEPVVTVAFTNVIFALFLVGEEVIGPTFLPVFMRELEEKGEPRAFDFVNALLTGQLILLLVVVAVVMCFPDFIIGVMTDWTPEGESTRYALLRESLVFLAPSLIFLSIGSTTYMLLNGYKKFFLAAFGDASTKICIVAAIVVGVGVMGLGYRAVLFGVLIGSAAKLATHLAGMLGKLRLLRFSLRFSSPAVRSMIILMLPLLVGIFFAKGRDLFNNVTVLTHIRGETGILMANDLGRKLFTAIQWLVPYALQIALFPFLCELVDRDDRESLGQALAGSCRLMLSVFVPGAVLLAVLARPVSAFIFLGGKMPLDVLMWTGISTACYVLVLPAASVECVLMQGYFADRRTLVVTAIGVVASVMSMIASYVFIVHFQLHAVQGLMVVALSFVVSRYLKSLVLAVVLGWSLPLFPLRPTVVFLVRLLGLAVVVGGGTYAAARGMDRLCPDGLAAARAALAAAGAGAPAAETMKQALSGISRPRVLAKLLVAGSAGMLGFFLVAWLLRIREPFDMLRWGWRQAAAKLSR